MATFETQKLRDMLRRNKMQKKRERRCVLDVTFREDDSRARSGHAPENLATLRRLALNLLKSEKPQGKLSLRGKRLMAAWNHAYLLKVLGI